MLAGILWCVRGGGIPVNIHKESKLPLYTDKVQSDVHVQEIYKL